MSDLNEPTQEESLNEKVVDRRDFGSFMKVLIIGGAASLLLKSSTNQPEEEPTEEESYQESLEPFEEYPLQPTELIPHENSFFEFEKEEHKVELPGMGWYPDGHVPFITLADGESKLLWITGHLSGIQGSFPYIWNPKTGLNPEVDADNIIIPAVSREQYEQSETYRNGYSGLTSVIPFNGGLLGFTHNEQWQFYDNGSNFTASVGLVFSDDGGQNFRPAGQPILGRERMSPGKEVTGAGQPYATKVKDSSGQEYAYIYYVEWVPRETKSKYGLVDQIYLARIALNENSIGAVEHLTNEGFAAVPDGVFAHLRPVITPPSHIPNSSYAALPGVSYDAEKGLFTCVFETNVGVCATRSKDGVSWSQAELLLEYPVPLSSVWANPGTESYSYPTLLDLSQISDRFTGENVILLSGKGIGHGKSHSMVAIIGKRKN